jgi:hypothetical protein
MTHRSDAPQPIAFAPCGRDGRRPERIPELLGELAAYWRQQSHLRLGQIVDNFANALAAALDLDGDTGVAARELEDDALLGMLRTGRRHPGLAAQAYRHPSAASESALLQRRRVLGDRFRGRSGSVYP